MVPSCATTGEGLFEGLVSDMFGISGTRHLVCLSGARDGYRIMLNRSLSVRADKAQPSNNERNFFLLGFRAESIPLYTMQRLSGRAGTAKEGGWFHVLGLDSWRGLSCAFMWLLPFVHFSQIPVHEYTSGPCALLHLVFLPRGIYHSTQL